MKKGGANAMVGIGRVYGRLELIFCQWHDAVFLAFGMSDSSGI